MRRVLPIVVLLAALGAGCKDNCKIIITEGEGGGGNVAREVCEKEMGLSSVIQRLWNTVVWGS